jgi:hypothetical protein
MNVFNCEGRKVLTVDESFAPFALDIAFFAVSGFLIGLSVK